MHIFLYYYYYYYYVLFSIVLLQVSLNLLYIILPNTITQLPHSPVDGKCL